MQRGFRIDMLEITVYWDVMSFNLVDYCLCFAETKLTDFYINNCPTRCNTKQSIYYFASSLCMFPVSTTRIIRSTQNCNYSLRYWSYFLCSYLPPTWSPLATLEGVPEYESNGGCSYTFVFS